MENELDGRVRESVKKFLEGLEREEGFCDCEACNELRRRYNIPRIERGTTFGLLHPGGKGPMNG